MVQLADPGSPFVVAFARIVVDSQASRQATEKNYVVAASVVVCLFVKRCTVKRTLWYTEQWIRTGNFSLGFSNVKFRIVDKLGQIGRKGENNHQTRQAFSFLSWPFGGGSSVPQT